MRNPFILVAALATAALSQIRADAVSASRLQGIGYGRSSNRFIGRSRTPGNANPAGTKIARMAAEGRIGKRS